MTYRTGEKPHKAALLHLCYRLASGEACCLLAHVWHSGITPALLELLESKVGRQFSMQTDSGLDCYRCGALRQITSAFVCCVVGLDVSQLPDRDCCALPLLAAAARIVLSGCNSVSK